MKRLHKTQYIVGIDEVGRGPLAGPVTVGIFGAEKRMEKWLLQNIFQNKLRDSKKLSPKKREEIYKKLYELQKAGRVFFHVSNISNKIVDKKGISYAIKLGIKKSLENLGIENYLKIKDCKLKILLDGSLKAPNQFTNQKTLIGGDNRNIFIACASIVAKVSRDHLMIRLSKKYPEYSFQIHKGYGTALHYSLIKKNGLSSIHRKRFIL